MDILRRILRYAGIFLLIFLVISVICIYQHRELLAEYFSSSISSLVVTIITVIAVIYCICLLLKPFRW